VFIVMQGQRGRRGDTTLLDAVAGHRQTLDALAAFLAGPDAPVEIEAVTRGELAAGSGQSIVQADEDAGPS
jgi:hypothetical protein